MRSRTTLVSARNGFASWAIEIPDSANGDRKTICVAWAPCEGADRLRGQASSDAHARAQAANLSCRSRDQIQFGKPCTGWALLPCALDGRSESLHLQRTVGIPARHPRCRSESDLTQKGRGCARSILGDSPELLVEAGYQRHKCEEGDGEVFQSERPRESCGDGMVEKPRQNVEDY